METSFFSGSENLYKYLVTIGLLLIIMTVYYPLKEKQELEILTIKLESDLEVLKYKTQENAKNVKILERKHFRNETEIAGVEYLNQQNQLNQIQVEKKFDEIKIRRRYTSIYHYMFWIFFPIGIALTVYGFIKWKRAKTFDDNILKLENEKLEFEVKKLRDES